MKTMGQLPMEVRLSREKHLQLKRVAEFERRYEMIMPITASVDEGQCRDEFVRKFCEPMQFVEINDEDSDSEEQSPRLSRKMTLDSFLMSARRILRTAETVDKFTYWEADPQKFSKMTGETGRYDELLESMKLSSLSYLFSRVIDRLRLLEGISLEHTEMDLHDLPHQIFKWSMEAFFNRVSLSDPVYLEVLQLDYPEEVLEWAKLSEDIGEMVRFFSYFQMEMFTSDKKNYQRLQTILYDQMQLLNIADEMDKTLQKSVRRFDTIEDKAHKALAAFKDIKREYLIEQCTQSSADALVLLPIEWRYVRDSYATLVEMQSHKDKLPVQQLEKQIADLRKRMEDHQKSSSEVSLVYKLVIENYQKRLQEFEQRLHDEGIYWDDKIQVATSRLAKTRNEYEEMEEKIAYMRQRVQQVRELMETKQSSESLIMVDIPLEPVEKIGNQLKRRPAKRSTKATKRAKV